MNEDYVTYEQAKALKEFGFNWECNHWYHPDEPEKLYESLYDNHNKFNRPYSAPTLAQVVKWLYEISGYFISVQYNEKIEKFQCAIYKQSFTQGYYCTNDSWPKLYIPDQDNLISYEPIRCLHKGINKVFEIKKQNKK